MAEFRLDRLSPTNPIVGRSGGPSQEFQWLIQRAWEKIEGAFDDLTTQQATLTAQQATLTAQQAEIVQAQADLATQLALIQAAQDAANAIMGDIPNQTILADYTGTVSPSDQLPLNIACKRYNGATDVSASSAWSVTVDSGGIACSIGAATGILSITAITSTAVLTVTSVHNSISRSKTFTVTLQLGAAPETGSAGGSSDSTSTFNTINSATHAEICAFTITTGSGGEIDLSAPLSVHTSAAAPAGVFQVYGVWQIDNGGWADIGTEVSSGTTNCNVTDEGGGLYSVKQGTLSVSATETGLTATTAYDVRLMARNSSGTRVMSFSGTASGVGS